MRYASESVSNPGVTGHSGMHTILKPLRRTTDYSGTLNVFMNTLGRWSTWFETL